MYLIMGKKPLKEQLRQREEIKIKMQGNCGRDRTRLKDGVVNGNNVAEKMS